MAQAIAPFEAQQKRRCSALHQGSASLQQLALDYQKHAEEN